MCKYDLNKNLIFDTSVSNNIVLRKQQSNNPTMWQNKQQFTIFTNLIFIIVQFLNKIYCLQERGTDGQPLPKAATFHFPEYAYKETSKNELTYHDFEVTCDDHVACEHLEGVKRKACVRRCISYSCYQDIYAFDELEDGEIDVRLNSFKGCVIQRTGNTNRRAT